MLADFAQLRLDQLVVSFYHRVSPYLKVVTHGGKLGPSGGTLGYGVPAASRPFGQRGTGAEVSTRARAGLGRAGPGGPASHAHYRGQAPALAGRLQRIPHLHLHPAEGRLPNAQGGRGRPCSIGAVARSEGIFRLPAGFKHTAQEYRNFGVGGGHSCR